MRSTGLLLALVLLAGCESNSYWYRDMPDFRPQIVTIEWVDGRDLAVRCGTHALACTMRNPVTSNATITLGPQADNCVFRHELRHLAGWNHDERPVTGTDCG